MVDHFYMFYLGHFSNHQVIYRRTRITGEAFEDWPQSGFILLIHNTHVKISGKGIKLVKVKNKHTEIQFFFFSKLFKQFILVYY